jgi:hypothetical protein
MADSNVTTAPTRLDTLNDLTRKVNQLDALLGEIWGRKVDDDTEAGVESEQSKLLWLATDLAREVKHLASAV